jgi:hypothetical protein
MECQGDIDELLNIPLCDEDPNTELSSPLLAEQQLSQHDVMGTTQNVAATPGYQADHGSSEPHSRVTTQQHSIRVANEDSDGMIDSEQFAADNGLTSGATWTRGYSLSSDDGLELLVGSSTAPMGADVRDVVGRGTKEVKRKRRQTTLTDCQWVQMFVMWWAGEQKK